MDIYIIVEKTGPVAGEVLKSLGFFAHPDQTRGQKTKLLKRKIQCYLVWHFLLLLWIIHTSDIMYLESILIKILYGSFGKGHYYSISHSNQNLKTAELTKFLKKSQTNCISRDPLQEGINWSFEPSNSNTFLK